MRTRLLAGVLLGLVHVRIRGIRGVVCEGLGSVP